jgi:hypothetical protein
MFMNLKAVSLLEDCCECLPCDTGENPYLSFVLTSEEAKYKYELMSNIRYPDYVVSDEGLDAYVKGRMSGKLPSVKEGLDKYQKEYHHLCSARRIHDYVIGKALGEENSRFEALTYGFEWQADDVDLIHIYLDAGPGFMVQEAQRISQLWKARTVKEGAGRSERKVFDILMSSEVRAPEDVTADEFIRLLGEWRAFTNDVSRKNMVRYRHLMYLFLEARLFRRQVVDLDRLRVDMDEQKKIGNLDEYCSQQE